MNGPGADHPGSATKGHRHAEPAGGLIDLARALRAGGAKLGSAALLDANMALAVVGPQCRGDVRAALRAALVRDPSDLELFELLFESFYPRSAGAVAELLTSARSSPDVPPRPSARRLAEALSSRPHTPAVEAARRDDSGDAAGTQSDVERFKKKDFEQMSAEELAAARRMIAGLVRGQALRRSRRSRAGGTARRLDLRAMLQHRDLDTPRYRTPVPTPRDVVLLIDISGSMTAYSRPFLHFAHALSRRPARVETFLFATRLSRITRTLRTAEPDRAIAAASGAAPDWDGGTRLGACLGEFNSCWGRRVLGGGARVFLLSDGLERDAIDLLERETTRLARTAHELIWINPLLRSPEYAPLAAGARVLARHADASRSAHNITSLADLARCME